MNELPNMKGLPYLPLDPMWLAESPAFASGDARLVRAFLRLLAHAWQATPAGSVPSAFGPLATITQLNESEVGEHHDDLFHGWTLFNGRLCFGPLTALCERISARHAEPLRAISDTAAAVVQGPDEFVLTPTAPVSARKGKHRLAKDWRISAEQRAWLSVNGFPDEQDHDFIAAKFSSHYHSKGEPMINWDAAFQNFALKENKSGLPSNSSRLPAFSPAAGSRAARFGAAGQQTRQHNDSVFDRAGAGRMSEGGVYG